MPVRRRIDRRRAEALPAWHFVFLSGYDFFDDLLEIGVQVDAYGRPDREATQAAWRDFGAAFLAEHNGKVEPLALVEFGPPNAASRRSRRAQRLRGFE